MINDIYSNLNQYIFFSSYIDVKNHNWFEKCILQFISGTSELEQEMYKRDE